MPHLKRALCPILCLLLLFVFSSARAEEAPSVTLTLETSSDYAASGDWITLLCTVRNVLDQPITDVSVSDPIAGDIGYAASIAPGSSETFPARVLVTEDCVCQPTAHYSLDGESLTAAAEKKAIRLESISLFSSLEIEADPDGDRLTLTVINQGSAPVRDVKASDCLLGDMGPSAALLAPGETVRFSRPLNGRTGVCQCAVTAVSASGHTVSLTSNEVSPDVPALEGEDALPVLTVSHDETNASQLIVGIENKSPALLENLRLTETAFGEERDILFLPGSGVLRLTWPLKSSDTGSVLVFCLTLPDGQSVQAEPISVGQVLRPSAQPAAVPLTDGISFRMAENLITHDALMASTAALIIVILLIWWISYRIRKRRERRRRMKKRLEQRQKAERHRSEKARSAKNTPDNSTKRGKRT